MSLINQVLQDLEKRNAENAPDQHQPSNIKAVAATDKRSPVFLLTILFIIGIISFIAFNFSTMEDNENPQKSSVTTNKAKLTQPINIQPAQQPDIAIKPIQIATKTDLEVVEETIISEATITEPEAIIEPAESIIFEETPAILIEKKPEKKEKPLSLKQLAQQLFQRTKKRQNSAEKQTKLTQVLNLDPHHLSARVLLAKSLLQQGVTHQAATLLDQSLKLFPQNLQFINLRSQLFLQNKQPQAALNILHTVDSRYVEDEIFLSLLAAAYQQNNEPVKSLKTYQKLLQYNQDKAEYWLGLAIALEKQGDAGQAQTAYQQAVNKNTLKPAIVSYIKQRLSILK